MFWNNQSPHFAFPPAVNQSSCFSTCSVAFGDVSVSDFNPCNECLTESLCFFSLEFPDNIGCWTPFPLFIYHLLQWDVFQLFCSFKNWAISFACWVLRILCIFCVSDAFCKYLLPVFGLPFYSLQSDIRILVSVNKLIGTQSWSLAYSLSVANLTLLPVLFQQSPTVCKA